MEVAIGSLILGILLLIGGFIRSRSEGDEESGLLMIAGLVTIAAALLWMYVEALLNFPNLMGRHLILPSLGIPLGLFLIIIGAIPASPFHEEEEDEDDSDFQIPRIALD